MSQTVFSGIAHFLVPVRHLITINIVNFKLKWRKNSKILILHRQKLV